MGSCLLSRRSNWGGMLAPQTSVLVKMSTMRSSSTAYCTLACQSSNILLTTSLLLKRSSECTVRLEANAARERIKQHIERRGRQPVALTEAMVRYWWRLLNVAVFGGKLPQPNSIRLVRHRGEYGWARPRAGTQINLTLQPTFSSRKLFLMVLVHEMVHAWDHYKGDKMSHGHKFMKWAPRILRRTTLELKKELHDDQY